LSAGGGATGNFPMDAHDISKDYGPLPYDIPRQWTTSFIYELPAGGGRRFTPHGVSGALASNWAVNGILTLTDGRPFTVSATDRSNTGQSHQNRANCIGDAVPSGFDQTIDHWFETKAFAEPAAFNFGSCGYDTVRGPGFKRMNLSVFRTLPFRDKRVELRVETFNLFNWVNYTGASSTAFNVAATPAATYDAATNTATVNLTRNTGFLVPTTIGNTLYGMRDMQFGLKFSW